MAKDSDKKAGGQEADKTGGMLSRVLADEKEFDRRTLWRIGTWGGIALSAVVLAVLANQAAQGWRRDRLTSADLTRQAQMIQSLARETQSESRQLASAIETLNTDRDRLYARVTVLEQGLDSVTGALAKSSTPQASAKSAAAAPSPVVQPSETPSPVASAVPVPTPSQAPVATASSAGPSNANSSNAMAMAAGQPGPAPAVGPVASLTLAEKSAGKSASAAPPAAEQSPTPVAASPWSAVAPVTLPTNPASAASLVATKSMLAPPDPAAGRLTEADKVARPDAKADAAKPTEVAVAKPVETPATTPAQKTEFAIDLGTANSVGGLRALWRGLVKTHGELAALRPIIIVKESNTGLGMQLRLGAGPLSDAAEAARICATLAVGQRPCETTVYDGQRLAVGNEPDAETKPAQPAKPTFQRRRGGGTLPQVQQQQQRHGSAATREEPAPPPASSAAPAEPEQPSTFSQLFRRS